MAHYWIEESGTPQGKPLFYVMGDFGGEHDRIVVGQYFSRMVASDVLATARALSPALPSKTQRALRTGESIEIAEPIE